MGENTCQAIDCERTHYGHGWCRMHWDRWRKTGGVRRPTGRSGRFVPAPHRGCAVASCIRPHDSRGYCAMHWTRVRKHGNPERVGRSGYAHPKGDRNPNWVGDRAGYNTVHNRLRRAYGQPTQCTHCGVADGRPIQWALNWDRVAEVRHWKTSRRGKVELLPYSTDPADYIGLCLKCHRAFDLKHAAA